MPFVEKGRLLTLNTPLGDNKLLLESFSGTEAVSELFHFELELYSRDRRIDFSEIMGQGIQFGIQLYEEGKERVFNGRVARFVQMPSISRLARYRAHVVPWLWFLSRTADCRIFQQQTAREIADQIFKEHGFSDFEFNVQGSLKKREYCVQYRETALAFVMRLFEEEGMFFYFRHEPQKHILVVADSPSAHKTCEHQAEARIERSYGSGYTGHEDSISVWRYEQQIRPGKYALTDYDFENPRTSLLAMVDTQSPLGGNEGFEIFDYPGGYEARNRGDAVVNIRMEEEEAAVTVVNGESNCRAFGAGEKFTLIEHERSDQNAEYVLLSVTHSAQEGGFYSGEGSGEAKYDNKFRAIPSSVPYRPPRVTTKPAVSGPQTAVVVGPGSEEIYTDKYGRVKVQFHWDRRGKANENSSCWIRVSQPWAGKGWGAINIPRIGQEVVVDFLEGDPDRPVITGRVYNGLEMPPYELPANGTMTAFKTNSSKGGGGFNELRFEDKKGEEQIFIHGQKDLDVRIENDARHWIGQDQHSQIVRDQCEKIDRDLAVTVGRDHSEDLTRDLHVKVGGKAAIEVAKSYSLKVKDSFTQESTGNASISSTQAVYIKGGSTVVVEGTAGLTIKCGGNFVTVNSAGVQIQGTMVMINSGGAALSGNAGTIVSPVAPRKPDEAKKADPGSKDEPGKASAGVNITAFSLGSAGALSPVVSSAPTYNPAAQENKDKTHWIEVELKDEDGKPVPGERFRVTLPDGSEYEGTLDEKGVGRLDHIDPGSCKVTFPNLDQDAWK